MQNYTRQDNPLFIVGRGNSLDKGIRLLKRKTEPIFKELRERKVNPKHSERLKAKKRRAFANNRQRSNVH